MFNMFEEQLFVCQSLLKEQRRPPTGGLIEALEESLGRGVSTPSPLIVGLKTTPGASEVCFSRLEENDWLLLGRNCPHRGVSCRSLFSYCGGDHERACLIGSKTLRVFASAFLRRKTSPYFIN